MPDKPQHGKGKNYHHSKKGRAKHRQIATAPQQNVVTETPQPVATTSSSLSASTLSPPTKSKTAQYPYINTELRSIGILAGIVLVILIVMALVLS